MVLRGYRLKRPFGRAPPCHSRRAPPRAPRRPAPRLLGLATVRARAVVKGEVIKINRLLEANLVSAAEARDEACGAGLGTFGETSAGEAVESRLVP